MWELRPDARKRIDRFLAYWGTPEQNQARAELAYRRGLMRAKVVAVVLLLCQVAVLVAAFRIGWDFVPVAVLLHLLMWAGTAIELQRLRVLRQRARPIP